MFKNIAYLLIAVIFILLYIRYIEHRSLYFPMKDIEFTPAIAGLAYDDIYIDTFDGERLNAWFIPGEDSIYTILFCHGNGGNISHRIDKLEILHELGFDIFIFDYRGYGKSSGRPSEKGFYKDVQAAYDYLVDEKGYSPDRIIPYGESLGGSVAINLAAKEKIRALITESAFTSVRDVAKAVYPFLPSFLVSSEFDSVKRIRKVNVPKLIIHSKNDEIIPFSQSLKLFEVSKEPKKHLILMGSHNTCYQDSSDLYVSGIRDFLGQLK